MTGLIIFIGLVSIVFALFFVVSKDSRAKPLSDGVDIKIKPCSDIGPSAGDGSGSD